VQTQLLAQNPAAELRVYAVWLPMLGGDAREKRNGNNMPDARMMHFWDVYYLYGPDATWETIPSPLIGSRSTIYGERQTLRMQVNSLLEKRVEEP
jgi:hypothetical protein